MRPSRSRFTVRWMMIAVGVAAVVFFCIALANRRASLLSQMKYHHGQMRTWEGGLEYWSGAVELQEGLDDLGSSLGRTPDPQAPNAIDKLKSEVKHCENQIAYHRTMYEKRRAASRSPWMIGSPDPLPPP